MWLSDVSVKRPVFATVVNLVLMIFGIVCFSMLPLREFPDIDSPVVSISTDYPGASAEIVESKITQQMRASFVRDPIVSVNISQALSRLVTVDGGVRRPGRSP